MTSEAPNLDDKRAMPGAKPRTHSILIVEDDEDTRHYLAHALDTGGHLYEVATAATIAQGLEALRNSPPEVLLVDLGLPDGNGIELIRDARRISTGILALVITVFGDEATVIRAIEAGAHGYLLKSEAPDDICLAVAQILAGGAPISPGIASHLLRRFAEPHTEPTLGAVGMRLTNRESEVLKLMVKGLPYQEAAEVLGVTRNTVTSHVKSIYHKLEVRSRGEAVFEALSRGIVKIDLGD